MFRFKHFSLDDSGATMKASTDAVLLGAWADVENASAILDIGTGSGIIALMAAQRSNALIDAVEIDEKSAEIAASNASQSPWADRVRVVQASFQQFAATAGNRYDVIISNPPYFRRSLKAPDPARCRARHDDALPVSEMMAGIRRILSPGGRVHLVFPSDSLQFWLTEASFQMLHCNHITRVVTRTGKAPYRILATFSGNPTVYSEDILTIHNPDGSYTEEYRHLTADFYLAF